MTVNPAPAILESGMVVLRYFASFLAIVLPSGMALGAEPPEVDPQVYAQAFVRTCRPGFPDLNTIARNAVAEGWIERELRPVGGSPDLLAGLHRAFSRNGLMLFLTRADHGAFRTVCQITGSAPTRHSGRDIAAALAPNLDAGPGVPGPGDPKRDDFATWTVAPDTSVAAGVGVYRGKTRTVSLSMRQARKGAPVPDIPARTTGGDIPMVAIGLSFAPESPTPVDVTHVLFHGLTIDDIDDLPPTIKSSPLNWIAAAKRSSVNAALRDSFARMNLLAPEAASARKRLTVSWKGDRTPFHIGTSNTTSVTLHYRLTRIDTGLVLFDRDITTSVRGGGADASMRDNGIVRAAIGANFASAANCIDRAAYGAAPADCALTPQYSVAVVRGRP